MPHDPNKFIRPNVRMIVDLEPWQAELLARAFAAHESAARSLFVPARLHGGKSRLIAELIKAGKIVTLVDGTPRGIIPPTAAMVYDEAPTRSPGFDWKDANRNAHKSRHKRTR